MRERNETLWGVGPDPRLLVKSLPWGLVVLSPELLVESVGGRFLTMWRARESDVVGVPLARAIPSTDLHERALQALASGTAQRNFHFKPTGGRGPVQCRADLVPLEGGGLMLLLDAVNPLTTHRAAAEANKAARSSDRMYANLLQDLDGILWEAEIPVETGAREEAATWSPTYVSQRAEQILGYPVFRWFTESGFWLRHVHEEDREHAVATYREVIEGKRNCEAEYRMIRDDGREVWLLDRVHPMLDARGRVCGLRGLMLDITERKRAEEAYLRSEANYREFVERASVGIYRSSLGGRVLSANRTLLRMLGYDSEEELAAVELGRDIYLDPRDRERLVELCHRQGHLEGAKVEWKRRDGTPLTVRLSGRAVHNDEGEIDAFETIVEDVTERQHLEAQLRQSQKMEAIGQLAGGVAHDFNNLMTVVLFYCGKLLRDERIDAAAREGMRQVEKAGERAVALTRRLLAFSRKQVLEPRLIDLNAIVEDTRKMLQRLIGENIELETALDAQPGSIKADPVQVEQVLLNLTVNARDAMTGGGRLRIETRNVERGARFLPHEEGPLAGPCVVLAVEDSGVGMDEKTKERIFEPFFTTKQPGQGTGLGLATVYGIIQQSGGQVRVESEPGRGTRFEIYFPRPKESAAERDPEEENPRSTRGTESILLVEDEDEIRGIAREILEERGYDVVEAEDGLRALELSERLERGPDLLLTDVVMPELGGSELARRLTDRQPDLRVLYMSGYAAEELTRNGMLVPGVTLLEKPFTPATLARRVREILDA